MKIALALLSGTILACGALSTATPRDLTPEVRALIAGDPAHVSVAHGVATIRLDSTDYEGNYKSPYVRVYVNGKGPFTFLFDTGSSFTIVSSKVIEAASLPVVFHRGGFHDVIRLKHMSVAGVDVSDLYAIRDDNFNIDGVLGFRAFGPRNLTFELAKRRLVVSERPLSLPGAVSLPYKLDHNLPLIPLEVDGHTIDTLIDSGDDAYAWEVRTKDIAGVPLVHPPLSVFTVINGGHDVSQTYVTTVAAALKLGELTAEGPVVGVNDALIVPDIGCDVMQQFNVEFDIRAQHVLFQPLFEGKGFAIMGPSTLGFHMKFDGSATVGSVVADSQAERLGIERGDTVLTVDGTPAARFTPRRWDELLTHAKSVAVTWRHLGEPKAATLTVMQLR